MVKREQVTIECRQLSVGYDGRAVLEEVDLSLRSGEVWCLLGQNGRGKTTLFRTLLGFIRPLSGEILLNGRALDRWSAAERARMIAYVPQVHQSMFPFRVEEVVLFGRTAHLGLFASPGRRDKAVAARAIEMLGIEHLADRAFPEISGGERQMVMLARALAQEAQMMILDEPASNLDYGNQVLLLRKVQELVREGIGIVMATHAPEQALHLDARVVTLEGRRAVAWPHAREALVPEVMKRVYGVEIDMISTEDSRGNPLRFFSPLQP